MLHETGEEWLPLSHLIAELYPDRDNNKNHNAVANVLRPLYRKNHLAKYRRGNYVSIRLTEKEINVCKERVADNEVERAVRSVQGRFDKIEITKKVRKRSWRE